MPIILTKEEKIMAKKLIEVAKSENKDTITYKELGELVTPVISPRQVGGKIGNISRLCKELGLPLISGIAVRKSDGQPGEGWDELQKELGTNCTPKDIYAHSDWSKLELFV